VKKNGTLLTISQPVVVPLEQWRQGSPRPTDAAGLSGATTDGESLHGAAAPGHTLQTTALINEAYLRLVEQEDKRWENRAHFFGVAAQAMRHILVDYARTQNRTKRGGGARPVPLDEVLTICSERSAELIALDDALKELAKLDERQSKVVELRFFGGLTEEEIAEVLKVSPRTVSNDWSLARSWLLRELNKAVTSGE
jgi:RNA polymerase sigma factor (TIGR02999 family)